LNFHSINYITNSPTKKLTINKLKTIVFVCLVVISMQVHSQEVTEKNILEVPNNRLITESLQHYYHIKLQADQHEYKAKQPPRWLNFLPTVGTRVVAFNDQIRAVPTVSISINQFISDKKEEYLKEAKLESISKKNEIQYHQDLNDAYIDKEKIKQQMTSIKKKQKLIELQRKIFSYDSIKYQKAEIVPDEFYRSKMTLIRQEFSLIQSIQSINIKILELYQTAKINTK